MRNLKYHPIEEFRDTTRVPGTQVGVSADSHSYFLPFKYDADAPPPEDYGLHFPYSGIQFIHLDKDGNYAPGVTDEQLLEVLIHRTEYFQTTVPCDENVETLTHLKAALQAKLDRTAKRQAQNVEGTHEKH